MHGRLAIKDDDDDDDIAIPQSDVANFRNAMYGMSVLMECASSGNDPFENPCCGGENLREILRLLKLHVKYGKPNNPERKALVDAYKVLIKIIERESNN